MEGRTGKGKTQSNLRLAFGLPALLAVILGLGALRFGQASVRTAFERKAAAPQLFQQGQSANAESELREGIQATQEGKFAEAIPHLLAARGHVTDEYAANFDLALCYVGIGKLDQAIQVLDSLKAGGHETAAVDDLLAQAYVGAGQDEKALAAFQQAVQQAPQDEKLYVLMADACMEHESYDLGMQVASIGLQHLANSAKLHYEAGAFAAYENDAEQASSEYEQAAKLAPGTDLAYMAIAQDDLLQGKIQDAIRITHKAIKAGSDNYILMAIFGDAVAQAGIAPDQSLFREAEKALAKSITERPRYAPSQLALGELLLTAGQVDEAVVHLQRARELAPADAAVYSHLAIAYRRKGRTDEERQALAILAKINQQQLQKYKTDSPNKAGYVASAPARHKPSR